MDLKSTVTAGLVCIMPILAHGQTWTNSAYPTQTGNFIAVWDAKPSQSGPGEYAVMGLANGSAHTWSNLAATARFNDTGTIDIMNGSNYSAMVQIPYTAGYYYHFRMEVNPAAHTYTVYVTPQGGTRTLIAQNYAFRNADATLSEFSDFATGASAGSVSIINFNLIPSTPVLTASPMSSDQINLAWSASQPPMGYSISAYAIFQNGTQIGSVVGNETSLELVGLAASTGYSYCVGALLNDGAGSAPSNTVSVATLAAASTAAPASASSTSASAPTPAAAQAPAPAAASNGAPVPDVASFASSDGSLIFVDNRQFDVENVNHSYSLTKPDSQTLRFELQTGDLWGGYGTERSEVEEDVYVNGVWGYPADTNIRVSYDFMLEPGNANTSQWVVIGQIQSNACCNPPFAVTLSGEHMQITTRTPASAPIIQYTDPNPIQRGHYYSMDIQVNFANGTLKVVRDGVTIVDISAQGELGPGNSRYYWKMGIYRNPETKTDTQAADYRNFVISP